MTIAKTMSQGTLQRVATQERDAGFEVVGQFGMLKIGGFWSRHTPKTPPMVVPVRNLSHVQECSVQHSSSLKMSGTEGLAQELSRCLHETNGIRIRGFPEPTIVCDEVQLPVNSLTIKDSPHVNGGHLWGLDVPGTSS
ncbi:hypothetical protein HLB42_17795 (plasmid) [Deinococcus sp. D7000]|nr:hypothetical protein HLB42_17795 [Deinococcus sp. D7000]